MNVALIYQGIVDVVHHSAVYCGMYCQRRVALRILASLVKAFNTLNKHSIPIS